MDDATARDENRFYEDEINRLVNEVIADVIGEQSFHEDKVHKWSGEVVDQCISRLVKRQQNYKYIVDVLIMQRLGGGVHSECFCNWNDDTDGSCTVSWKNKSMNCIVTVFGLSV